MGVQKPGLMDENTWLEHRRLGEKPGFEESECDPQLLSKLNLQIILLHLRPRRLQRR
jgi:hypothetical protein